MNSSRPITRAILRVSAPTIGPLLIDSFTIDHQRLLHTVAGSPFTSERIAQLEADIRDLDLDDPMAALLQRCLWLTSANAERCVETYT